jgi:hypothetical protein
MKVFLSEDEEQKYIKCDEENFEACYAFGEWCDRKVIELKGLRELDAEEDYYEVSLLLRQARRALLRYV